MSQASKIRSAHTPAPRQTVYNNGMKRRSNLAKDILTVLAEGPQPLGIIVPRIGAKRNSIKSVLWKLLRENKIYISGTSDAVCTFGPKKVNVYCLSTQPTE